MSQMIVWLILISSLALIVSGRFRFDLVAISGLMIVGILGIAPPVVLLSGFGNPALFAVASILVISEGVKESRLFSGVGQALEHGLRKREHQLLGLALTTSFLSAFMNNVGTLSVTLPTARRMAERADRTPGTYTMPLAYAAILGGSITLAGSAPNIIVSSYRAEAVGRAYGMFDFAPHGLAFVFTGLLLWLICQACGISTGREDPLHHAAEATEREQTAPDRFPQDMLSTPSKRIALSTLVLVLGLVSLGVLPTAVAFGSGAAVFIAAGVITPTQAYRRMDFSLVVFLGAMLGLAQVLQQTGAIRLVTAAAVPAIAPFSPLLVIAVVFLASSILGSMLNNAASAAIMAPIALDLTGVASADSLLMAVAAGSCLSMTLPTHQATLMAMSRGWFSPARFARAGALLTLACAAVGSVVILLLWN